MSHYKYFKRVAIDILILLCCSAWSKRCLCTSFIMVTVQYFSNVTQWNILVNVVSSDHIYTAYCIGFCFRCHCTCMTEWFLKRSRDLIIKRVHRYNNHRYYWWVGKLMLHRNWLSHTIPTIIWQFTASLFSKPFRQLSVEL